MIPYINLLIPIAIINILWIWGFNVACRVDMHDDENPNLGYNPSSRMIFWKVKVWSLKTFGAHGSKGLVTCPPCQSGIWSIPFFTAFILLAHLPWYSFLFILVYSPCLIAINYVLSLIIGKLES